MSRVFTVNFRFREKPCSALVRLQNSEGYNPAFSVHYLDKDVETILPGRKIVFSLANGLETPQALPGERAEELLQQTSEAISCYLQNHN